MHQQRIIQVIDSVVLPSLFRDASRRFVIARDKIYSNQLPRGVTISPQPVKGERIIRRNKRRHSNQRLHIADWPEANLQEMAVPRMAYIVHGHVDYLLGKYCVHCGAGTIVLIPAGMPHQRNAPFCVGIDRNDSSYLILNVYTYNHGAYCWLSGVKKSPEYNRERDSYLIPGTRLSEIMNLLMEEAIEAKEEFENACDGLLTAFFTKAKREIKTGNYTHPGPSADYELSHRFSGDFSGQLHEYLEKNCHRPLKLADVAAYFFMSPSTFKRHVRRDTGSTFGKMLVNVRIERAKVLLRNTDWTFKAICSHLSFRSSSYFLSLFRQHVGCTPREFRQQLSSQDETN